MLGLLLLELLLDIADAGRDVDLGADHGMADHHNRRAEGMVRRQDTDRLFTEVNIGDDVGEVGEDIVLREHDALALAGGAGGEDEQRHGVGIDAGVEIGIGRPCELLAAGVEQGLEAAGILLGQHVDRLCLKVEAGGDVLGLLAQLLVAEEEGGVGLDGGVGEILLLPVAIEGNDYAAHREDGEVGAHPIVGILADDHAVAAGNAHGDELGGQCADIVAHLAEADADDLGTGCGAVGIGDLLIVGLARPFNEGADVGEIAFFVKLFLLIHFGDPSFDSGGVCVAHGLQVKVDAGEGVVHDGAVLLADALADAVEDAVDPLSDKRSDLAPLFGEGKRGLVAFGGL